MTVIGDYLDQAARGEPIALGGLLVAICGEFGAELNPGDGDSIIRLATLAIGLWLVRRHTTPRDNPVAPTRTVLLENGEHLVGARRPVLTFRGRRAA